jgi:ribosomal protein S12 methylthiotransferase accessory factor
MSDILLKQFVQYRGKKFNLKKKFYKGTHRTCPPEETFERIRPTFKTIGLTRLANVTGLDRIGMPVVLSVRPNAGYLAVDAGKGFTLMAASVSAAMECIERYHGEVVRMNEIRGSYNEIAANYQAIPLENISLVKNSLFHVDLPERWTLGWDIINQCEVAVPVTMVTMESYKYSLTELVSFQIGSNGLASGNVFLEALCSALYEVVERDGIACHRVAENMLKYHIPRVKLDTIEHPLVVEQIERLERAGVKPVLFDCTVDTDVPTYMAYIYDLIIPKIGVYRGYGAHLDPEIGMLRALNEAAQARGIFISGSRDDFFRYNFNRLKRTNHQHLINRLEKNPENVDGRERKSRSTDTFEGDILKVLERLKRVHINQVIVFDITLPGFDASVVRVIVPGLEGYMFDYYQPGRRALDFVEKSRGGGSK